jgi:flagellar motor switch protein FliM
MKCLSFVRSSTSAGGRRVREATFEERSLLPTTAACLVANGVRETLSSLLGTTVQVRLFEPVIPSPDGWHAITRDALLYRLRGPAADAAIVLRPDDAVAFASAAFGETASEGRPLSTIERSVLDRTICAIAGAFSPVCGIRGESPAPEGVAGISGFVTYFELQIDRPGSARLGVALSREPQSQPQNAVSLDSLLGLGLELEVRFDSGSLSMADLADLEPGAILPMTQGAAFSGTLYLAGRPVARGECGVRRDRYAIAINEYIEHERSHQSAS